jgi:YD repeat-containing protein
MSSGRLVTDPNYLWQYTEEISVIPRITEDCNYHVLSSESNFPLGTTQGSYVGYSFVTEQQVDKSGNPLGKTEQTFSFFKDGIVGNNFPFYPRDNRDWMRGHPILTSMYSYDQGSKTYSLVRETRNAYEFESLVQASSGWKYGISWKIVGMNGQHSILGGSYGIYSGYFMKSRTQVFERGALFERRIDYTYSTQSLLPVKTTEYKSDGTREHVLSTYPLEYAAGTDFIDVLRSANILNVGIEHVTVNEDAAGVSEIVGGTWKKYDLFGNVTELYNLELSAPLKKASFKFSSRLAGMLPPEGVAGSFSADTRYVKRITYDAYDGSRLLQYTLTGNANEKRPTAVLWGYNGMYPVAEIQNASYATVSSVLGGNVSFGAGTLSQAQQSLLRTSASLRDAMVSTYAYTPFVGMTSSMDANNVSTTYDYDAFGRLRAVRDQRGDLMSSFRYNHGTPGVAGADLNFIEESTVNVVGIRQVDALATRPVEEVLRKKQFFDGLGRPSQTVTEKGSSSKQDVVQPFFYDVYGRESVQYLPYVSAGNTGWFNNDATGVNSQYTSSAHYNFYNGTDAEIARSTTPYAATVFEVSPLGRVLKQGATGEDWQPGATNDHSEKKEYLSNAAGEVLLFSYTSDTEEITCYSNGAVAYYLPNALLVDVTRDEHDNEIREYKDKDQRTVLKRVQYKTSGTAKEYTETYYIYDDFDNLVTVLAPEAVRKIKQSIAAQ